MAWNEVNGMAVVVAAPCAVPYVPCCCFEPLERVVVVHNIVAALEDILDTPAEHN